jgi:hypothetical protein
MLYPLTLSGGHVWVAENRCGMGMTRRQSKQSIRRACSADTEQSALNKFHSTKQQSQHDNKNFFLNPSRQAMVSMKKVPRGSPAKIAPVKPPKEIHTNPTPRCAMQARLIDQPKA